MSHETNSSPPRALTLKAVMAHIGMRRCSICQEDGNQHHFPRPIKIGHAARWDVVEIDAWVRGRLADAAEG